MNSRERVLLAINGKQPDRVPIDLGGTAASGINVSAYLNLKRLLGLRTDEMQVFDIFGMMARVEQDVIEHFGIDTLLVPSLCPYFGIPINEWKSWSLLDGASVQVPVGFHTTEDKDGSLLLIVDGQEVGRMPRGETYFLMLEESDVGGLAALVDPPDPDSISFSLFTDEDLRFRQNIARDLYETTDKALVITMDNIRWDTSLSNWFYAMAADPDRTFELHEKKSFSLIEKVKQLAEAVEPYVCVCTFLQDYGTQRGEMVSPETFERLVVPHYRRVFDWIHENTSWKVMFHSCGSIYNLLPHMIEMGVDIINPVQCRAARMEPQRLKAEFGDRLVFWGGGVDTQTVFPFGSTGEVRQQVRERISILGQGGGFVFAPSQDIQGDVSAANVVAAYEAAREFGGYPLETSRNGG